MRCGIAPYSRNLASGLSANGLELEIVIDHEGQDSVFRLIQPRSWSVLEMFRLALKLRRRPQRIIHLQHPTRSTRLRPGVYLLPIFVRVVARQHRIVSTFHYLCPVDLRTAVLRVFFLVPAAFSHAVIVTTPREESYARRLFPKKSIVVAPAGPTEVVDHATQDRQATRTRLGLTDQHFLVAYFGYLLPNKGLETLFRALAATPEQTKLMVIGGGYSPDDSYPSTLRSLAVELGLKDRIIWSGAVPSKDIGPLLSAADCAALPFDEGASLKRSTLITVLLAGLPTICTHGEELDPSMQDNETILLVPPRDPTAIARALTRLYAEPELRQSLTQSAPQILDRVQWPKIVAAHMDLYSLLGTDIRLSSAPSQY